MSRPRQNSTPASPPPATPEAANTSPESAPPAPPEKAEPDRDLGVAVKRDGRWYQIVTVRRVSGKVEEVPGRRTDNKLIAAEWLSSALLESNL